MSEKKRVLFLSTGNACRSLMAEGFSETLAGHLIEGRSAGVEPAAEADPRAVKVMNEDWTDIAGRSPKAVTDAMLADVDMVITLSEEARERCPALPEGVEHRHWAIDDATTASGDEQRIMNTYRGIQDEVKENILFLINEIRGSDEEFQI
ncbi:MAG: arsenate reductase ArsC [Halorhodospira sp.]